MSEYNYGYESVPADKPVSKSTGIVSFIMGLLSVVCPWSILIAIIMGIVGLVLSSKASKAGDTSGFVKAGRILSIIGLILSVLAIVILVVYFILMFALGIGIGLMENSVYF